MYSYCGYQGIFNVALVPFRDQVEESVCPKPENNE